MAPDEESNFDEGDLRTENIVRLRLKQWASSDDIDRTRCLHYFSKLHPSNLLFNLCSVLLSLGIHHTISDEKMKVTFTREKPLNVWWEEHKHGEETNADP